MAGNVTSGPTPDRSILARGAWASVFSGAAWAASSGAEMVVGDGPGFGVPELAIVIAVAFEAVVLSALGRAATILDSGPLRRAAACSFVGVWLIVAAYTVGELAGDAPVPTAAVLVAFVIGSIALWVYATGGAYFLPLLVVFYFVPRYLLGWLIQGQRFGFEITLMISAALFACVAVVGYPLWFARNLFRVRGRVGGAATAFGWAVVAEVLLMLGMVVWGGVLVAGAEGAADMNEEQFDSLLAPVDRGVTVGSIVMPLVTGIANAWFLLAVRRVESIERDGPPSEKARES